MSQTAITRQRVYRSFKVSTELISVDRDCADAKKRNCQKTFNSGYSLVVTHLTTNPPVRCLNRAERTGSLVLSYSIVSNTLKHTIFGLVFSVNRYSAIIATANYAACRRRSIQGKEAKH
jgi:hypothetical protein